MNEIRSYADYETILGILNTLYPINGKQIGLHRDMIGRVYFVESPDRKAVLKLYRSFDTDNALQSISVINYLGKKDYPVVSIIPAKNDDMYVLIKTPDGLSVGVLYDFIDGVEVESFTEIEKIGVQTGRLHRLMEKYPSPLMQRGKDYYIGRYISVLNEKGYNQTRIDELEDYGNELWENMKRLPQGFCHGDMHSGNMRLTEAGDYILFDFDGAAKDHSILDVGYLCDATNFNRFNEGDYDKTRNRFGEFYKGYSKEYSLSMAEIQAIFDVIAIRHFSIIATIVGCQGQQSLSVPFLDEQYEWLMKWRNLCDRRRDA